MKEKRSMFPSPPFTHLADKTLRSVQLNNGFLLFLRTQRNHLILIIRVPNSGETYLGSAVVNLS